MATKKTVGSWSLGYFLQKLGVGVQETLGQFPNATSASAAIAAGFTAFKSPVSGPVFHMTGNAMVGMWILPPVLCVM